MPYRPTATTQLKAAQKRAELLRAATRLVAAYGFASATVTAVTRACNVSSGSLYTHFDTRDDFLAEVFRVAANHELAAVRRAVDAAATEPERQLAAMIDAFAGRALRGRQLAWSLLFEPVSVTVERERLNYRRTYEQIAATIIADGIERHRFADQDVTLAACAVIGAISESLVGRLAPLGSDPFQRTTDTQTVAAIEAFCLRALGTHEPGHAASDLPHAISPAPEPIPETTK